MEFSLIFLSFLALFQVSWLHNRSIKPRELQPVKILLPSFSLNTINKFAIYHKQTGGVGCVGGVAIAGIAIDAFIFISLVHLL